jgi:1-acyl-sn-glycerol-3-phosphate acyltransferase
MDTFKHFSVRRSVSLSIMAGSVSALWFFRSPLLLFASALRDQQSVSAFVHQFGLLGPAILLALLVIQVVLAVLPGHALILAGGYLYGFPNGLIVTAAGTILGGQMAFIIARLCGQKVVNYLASPALVDRWDRLAKHQGGKFFLLTFILPVFPSDVLCYVAGLGKISSRSFLVVNILGRLPCAIILTLIGAYGLRLPTQFWLVICGGIAVLLLIVGGYIIYKRLTRDPGATIYAVVCWIVRCYPRLFRLRCDVRGASCIAPGAKILAANHPNATDTFFLPGVLSERLYVLVQGNLFNLPVFGWLLTHSGMIPVRPDRRHLAFEKACELLRQGHTILIYPEGKLNPSGIPLHAGTGAVRMSLATGAPIIPIGIHVADQDVHSLRYRSMSGISTGRWQVRGCCSITFGEAWMPSREIVTDERLATPRFLTATLMEKIYRLADLTPVPA